MSNERLFFGSHEVAMVKRVALGCCSIVLVLLFSERALADTITARLTVTGRQTQFNPGPPPTLTFQEVAHLDAMITLEPAPGPFWWPWFSDYLSDSNGYLVTSLIGTWSVNGRIDEPATLAAIDPLRPFWMHRFSEQVFGSGYLAWATPSGGSGFHDEISRLFIPLPAPLFFAEGSASAVLVPESTSFSLVAIGIVGFAAVLRGNVRLLRPTP
jgi:hypothetical protein